MIRTSPRAWMVRTAGLALVTAVPMFGCGEEEVATVVRQERATRTYFIAADEVDWNYAPGGNRAGEKFDDKAAVFLTNRPFDPGAGMAPTDARIGRSYRKALYREYTDETFTTPKPVPAEWQHLGALGPVIRGAVGDTIRVIFRNRTPFDYSVHAHGVFYDKTSEGAPYPDGTGPAEQADDAVSPGGTHTYVWHVPERAGPGPGDGSSVLWMYHSHVDEPADTYAGLIGPIIITKAGMAKPDGSPKDVDREMVVLFHVYNENASQFLPYNAARFANISADALETVAEDEDFEESNLMHGMNGYVYNNVPGLTMRVGERVRWYVFGMGTEIDVHTPHWHGATLLWNHMRVDSLSLLPSTMLVADMVPDATGAWLYHCHVNDHIDAGMIAAFIVAPAEKH